MLYKLDLREEKGEKKKTVFKDKVRIIFGSEFERIKFWLDNSYRKYFEEVSSKKIITFLS